MDKKEFRAKIYSWLWEEFEIQTSKISKEKINLLKKIINEFSPTEEVKKVAIKKEVVNIKPKANKWNTLVWRDTDDK